MVFTLPDGTPIRHKPLDQRDYFAGKVIVAMVAKFNAADRKRYLTGHADGRECAVAYAIADAMLRERAK